MTVDASDDVGPVVVGVVLVVVDDPGELDVVVTPLVVLVVAPPVGATVGGIMGELSWLLPHAATTSSVTAEAPIRRYERRVAREGGVRGTIEEA